MLFRFENAKADKETRLLWMPPVVGAVYTNQEQSLKMIVSVCVPRMEPWNMSLHDFTASGLPKLFSLQVSPSRSFAAWSANVVMKDSTKSRPASRRVSVPQKSAA